MLKERKRLFLQFDSFSCLSHGSVPHKVVKIHPNKKPKYSHLTNLYCFPVPECFSQSHPASLNSYCAQCYEHLLSTDFFIHGVQYWNPTHIPILHFTFSLYLFLALLLFLNGKFLTHLYTPWHS